jgi:hypothetical protein
MEALPLVGISQSGWEVTEALQQIYIFLGFSALCCAEID